MVTRPALLLALLYLAHRVNRLVTEVEAWRYEQTAKAAPRSWDYSISTNAGTADALSRAMFRVGRAG